MNNTIKINKNNKKYIWDTISHNLLDVSATNLEEYLSDKSILDLFEKEATKNKKKILNVYLGVTLECNLECSYCFEKSITNLSTLTPQKLELIFYYLKEYKEFFKYDEVNVVFYGGEPLLFKNQSIIDLIFDKINNLGYSSRIITNGVEINYFFKTLKKYKKIINDIEITVDGEKEVHDSFRKSKKEGSFDKIMLNLKKFFKENLYINLNLRINISKENIESIQPLMEYLKKENLYKKINNINLRKIEDKTGNLVLNNIENDINILKKYLFLKKEYRKLNLEILNLSTILKIFENPSKVVMPIFKTCNIENQLIFSPNGHIYNCSEAMGIKDLKIGSYYPDINLNFKDIAQKRESYNSNFTECLNCSVKYICGGHCYLEVLSNNFVCKKTKSLIKNMLEEKIKFDFI